MSLAPASHVRVGIAAIYAILIVASAALSRWPRAGGERGASELDGARAHRGGG